MNRSTSLKRLGAPFLICAVVTTAFLQRDAIIKSIDSVSSSPSSPWVTALLGTLAWMSAAWLVSRLIAYLIVSTSADHRTGAHAPEILINTISAAIYILTFFLIYRFVFDKDTSGLLATSGIATLIIGFAIREMIADFFSGMAISAEQPYRIGDWLEIESGLIGKVVELNWRATRLETQEKKVVVVANSDLASRQFTNLSSPTRAFRDEIEIALNYTSDPTRIHNILQAAILTTEGLHPDGKHDSKIKRFTERGVIYAVRFWLSDYSDRARVRDSVASNVLHHLNQAGVSIPYSQADILITRRRRPRKETRINARRLLSRIDWLQAMTEEELDNLADVAQERVFHAGDEIVREGDEGDQLYVVVEGLLEAHRDFQGRRERIGVIEPGQAIGEMSLLTGAQRTATVIAKTQVFALAVGRDAIEVIFKARPEIAGELGRLMATRSLEAKSAGSESLEANEELMDKAKQIARRITAFFSLGSSH
ncbi:MAG: mechanosensitive ion channel family protein [Pseudomonadota bacterium]